MHVVLHDFGGYPFSAQLARQLATGGHHVTYLYRSGFRAPRADVLRQTGDPRELEMRGIDVSQPYRGAAGVRRLLQERRYGRILAAAIRESRPDVVISANCPLDAQAMALDSTLRSGGAFVYWLQDMYSHAVARLLSRRFPVLGKVAGIRYARLERATLQRSNAVVAIADDFEVQLREWSIESDRIAVIENWAPLEDGLPGAKVNEWTIRHRLVDRPVILYAGTLGRKHNPGVLLSVAAGLPEAMVVVVAEGVGADTLARSEMPPNLVLLPLQPAAELGKVLASADVLIALLDPDAREFSVPSKVLTYFAAGRAVLGVMPRGNLASRTIVDADAGIVVDPVEDDVVAAARSLLSDETLRSRLAANGRAWAEARFDVAAKARAFEMVMKQAVGQRPSAGPVIVRDEA